MKEKGQQRADAVGCLHDDDQRVAPHLLAGLDCFGFGVCVWPAGWLSRQRQTGHKFMKTGQTENMRRSEQHCTSSSTPPKSRGRWSPSAAP